MGEIDLLIFLDRFEGINVEKKFWNNIENESVER